MDQPPAETLDRLARDLADIDVALARLDDGTYGTCETCGVRLDEAALADRPTLRTCPDHGPAPADSEVAPSDSEETAPSEPGAEGPQTFWSGQ